MFPFQGISTLNRIKNGKRTFVLSRLIVVLVFLLLTAMPSVTQADVFSCSADDVACLIDAIEDAHTTVGADTIILAPGTYTLTAPYFGFGEEGLPPIGVAITIQSGSTTESATIQRSGDTGTAKFRIFTVQNTGNLIVKGLIIKGGEVDGDGGGIWNNGTLALVKTSVSNNNAGGDGGGIWNRRSASIGRSIVEDNTAGNAGGGIHNVWEFSELDVRNSTIEDNQAVFGGGISNKRIGFLSGGLLSITNSTVHSNDASSDGGGIWNTGFMTVINTTVSNNEAVGIGGGIDNGLAVPPIAGQPGTDVVINTTITGNQASFAGGLLSFGATELQNTILAGNTAPVGPDCTQPLFTSLGHNLIGDTTDCPATFLPSDILNQNPNLTSYNDDGPGGGHFELQPTSPAIDAADNSACVDDLLFDQLGFPRRDSDLVSKFDANVDCDIGAIEYQPPVNRYRFVVLADSRDDRRFKGELGNDGLGVNEAWFPKVMESIAELRPQPTFILFSGDLVVGRLSFARMVNNEFADWQEVVTQHHYPLANVYLAFGGHERIGRTCSNDLNKGCSKNDDCGSGNTCGWEDNEDAQKPSWSAFTTVFDPVNQGGTMDVCEYFNNGTTTTYGRTVYYCDYKNARFFFLNNDCKWQGNTCTAGEHIIDSDQRMWISSKLNQKDLNFFIQHEPAYGTHAHNSSPTSTTPPTMDAEKTERNNYIELLGDHGATMIFSGHEHQYTRRFIDQDFAGNIFNNPDGSQLIFLGKFFEVKTGTSGAPDYHCINGDRNDGSLCAKYAENLKSGPQLLDTGYDSSAVDAGAVKPHYAVVDVTDNVAEVKVISLHIIPSGDDFVIEQELLIDAFTNHLEGQDLSFLDQDDDGALDAEETSGWRKIPITASGEVDTDSDGSVDYQDDDTARFASATGRGQVAIYVPDTKSLENVDSLMDPDPLGIHSGRPANTDVPFGLNKLTISGVTNAETITTNVLFPSELPSTGSYGKYDENTNQWFSIALNSVSGNQYTFDLMEGGFGDLGQANDGIIVDPGSKLSPSPEVVNEYVSFDVIEILPLETEDISECVPVLDYPVESPTFDGKFTFIARLLNDPDKNTERQALYNLVARVRTLTEGNLLLGTAGSVPGGEGSILTIPRGPRYSDGKLEPEGSVDVTFSICLSEIEPFIFLVDVEGRVEQ